MASKSEQKVKAPSKLVNFSTAGLGGIFAWICIHPFNTLGIRMNLAHSSGAANANLSFFSYASNTIKKEGVMNLYQGLSAGILRQVFYATSRLGFFEVIRDEVAKHRQVDFASRLFSGVTSGAIAALISCPAEVTLVRISNDSTLPVEKRRNYTGVLNAFQRILKEEGAAAFFRGSSPFVNRAMLVGAVQIGTYDQFREMYKKFGVTNANTNVFYASMTSGLLYSIVTNPFETAKNRMAFQKPDPITGKNLYTGAIQTMRHIVKNEGARLLWAGFLPYYLRCGGHTVFMFMSVEWLRTHVFK